MTSRHHPHVHRVPMFGELGRRNPPSGTVAVAGTGAGVAGGPVFSDPNATPDPTTFSVGHPSDDATYAQIGALLKTQVVDIPASRVADGRPIWIIFDYRCRTSVHELDRAMRVEAVSLPPGTSTGSTLFRVVFPPKPIQGQR